jgi:hypothetical protein
MILNNYDSGIICRVGHICDGLELVWGGGLTEQGLLTQQDIFATVWN